MQDIQISVDAWVIQDGNYGDFAVGELLKCAIEFFGPDLRPSLQRRASMVHLRQSVYCVCAQVIYASPQTWAINFGLPAFQDAQPPEFAHEGAWVEGEIDIGIDPFFYKDDLCKLAGMPDLFNRWKIARIERYKDFSDDSHSPRWTDVQQTDAWNDDAGRSAYLLHLHHDAE